MKRRMCLVAGLSLVSSAIVGVNVASAEESCSSLDPECLVTDTVGGIEETVDAVTAPIGPIVDDTVDEVDRILNPRDDDSPDGGDEDEGEPHQQRPSEDGRRSGGGTALSRGGGFRPRGGVVLDTLVAPIGPALTTPDLADRIGETFQAAAQSLGWVLALLLVAVGFITIQDRIDRRDPKLALAPVESDVVRFV